MCFWEHGQAVILLACKPKARRKSVKDRESKKISALCSLHVSCLVQSQNKNSHTRGSLSCVKMSKPEALLLIWDPTEFLNQQWTEHVSRRQGTSSEVLKGHVPLHLYGFHTQIRCEVYMRGHFSSTLTLESQPSPCSNCKTKADHACFTVIFPNRSSHLLNLCTASKNSSFQSSLVIDDHPCLRLVRLSLCCFLVECIFTLFDYSSFYIPFCVCEALCIWVF